MIVDYMSSDDLSKHLDRQMSIHAEKYREPEQDEEVDEVHVKALIKISFFSFGPWNKYSYVIYWQKFYMQDLKV